MRLWRNKYVEYVYKTFILRIGMLKRTNRGRMVTRKAYEHLGKDFSGQSNFL